MKKNCKIVQDLLPQYIEKMTSEETNKMVTEHLKECPDCKEVFNNMKTHIDKEKVTITKKEIDYIKNYRRKILALKLVIIFLAVTIVGTVTYQIGSRYQIVAKTIEKNMNYDLGGNYILAEYEDSIEYDEHPTLTYYAQGKMKKVEGDTILEYADEEQTYIFNQDRKECYQMKKALDDKLTIPTNGILNFGENGKPNGFEILKFVLSSNINIHKEGFRNKEYYVIKEFNGEKVYIDMDTYFIQRVVIKGNTKEYRVFPETVNYRHVTEPELTGYQIIEK